MKGETVNRGEKERRCHDRRKWNFTETEKKNLIERKRKDEKRIWKKMKEKKKRKKKETVRSAEE